MCDLACSHCYNEPRFSDKGGLIQLKTVKKEKFNVEFYKQIVKRLAEWGIFSATPTGGEVLTVKERLYPVLEELAKANIDISINSNLNLLTLEDVTRFKEFRVNSVLTSLASYDKENHDGLMGRSGAYEKTISGIKLLRENSDIYIGSNMVVSQENIDQIFKTGKLAKELGIDCFSLSFLVPARSAGQIHLDKAPKPEQIVPALKELVKIEDELELRVKTNIPVVYCRIYEHLELRRLMHSECSAGRSMVQIGPNGDVRPCPSTVDIYGNILRDNLDQLWARFSDWQERNYTPETCKPCDFIESCGGGCRAEAERISGRLEAKHPYSIHPIKVQDQEPQHPIREIKIGYVIKPVNNLRWRKEGEGFIVGALGDRYMFCSELEFNMLAAVTKTGFIRINEEIANNQLYRNFFSKALSSSIMEAN